MNPSIELRIKTMIRALTEVIIPAVDPNNSLAQEQARLDEAVEKGSLPMSYNTKSEAAFIQDLWSGAQQRASILRKTDPLHQAVEAIRHRLS